MPADRSTAVGRLLKAARRQKGLTLEGLSAKAKISTPYLCKIELGQELPPPKTFLRVARAAEVSPNEIAAALRRLEFERQYRAVEQLLSPDVAHLACTLDGLKPAERRKLTKRCLEQVLAN